MNTNKLPFGVCDYLPEKLAARLKTEAALEKALIRWGGQRIEPPALDYADNYLYAGGTDPGSMFKLTDNDGSLLVLRPDATMQIARIAATKLKPENALKLYYVLNSYENNTGRTGMRSREFAQIGAELFNRPAPAGDIEIIALAAKLLTAAGISGFRFEIGHVGYLKSLLSEAKLSPAAQKQVVALIKKKDHKGASDYLAGAGVPKALAASISAVTGLYGGEEVIDAAEGSANSGARRAAAALRRVVEGVKKKLPDLDIHIDLGHVSGLSYYSGTVFRASVRGFGAPILEGGRYDELTAEFGKRMPAVGFAVGTARASEVLSLKSERDDRVTFALAKGRLAAGAVDILEKCGVDCRNVLEETRKLVLEDAAGKYRFIFVKPSDVAVYIERGAADIGFVGKDTLMEDSSDVYEMLDLGYGVCKLCAAGVKGGRDMLERPEIKVATKYPNSAKRWFFERGQHAEVIKLNGSIELAPLLGMADCIVDIVESGKTLVANGLEVYEDIADISTRLIVNKVSLKLKPGVVPLIKKISELL